MSFNLSKAQRGWTQAVSPQWKPPMEGDHQSWCAQLTGSQLGAPAWPSPHPRVWTRVEIH